MRRPPTATERRHLSQNAGTTTRRTGTGGAWTPTTRDASARVAPNPTSWMKPLTEALRRQASVLQRPPIMFEQLELLAARSELRTGSALSALRPRGVPLVLGPSG